MGKGEIACFEQFLLFPQCFQRLVLKTHKNQGLFGKELTLKSKRGQNSVFELFFQFSFSKTFRDKTSASLLYCNRPVNILQGEMAPKPTTTSIMLPCCHCIVNGHVQSIIADVCTIVREKSLPLNSFLLIMLVRFEYLSSF